MLSIIKNANNHIFIFKLKPLNSLILLLYSDFLTRYFFIKTPETIDFTGFVTLFARSSTKEEYLIYKVRG